MSIQLVIVGSTRWDKQVDVILAGQKIQIAWTFSNSWNQKNQWQERIPNSKPVGTCSKLAGTHFTIGKIKFDENYGVQKVRNWNNRGIAQNSEGISQPRFGATDPECNLSRPGWWGAPCCPSTQGFDDNMAPRWQGPNMTRPLESNGGPQTSNKRRVPGEERVVACQAKSDWSMLLFQLLLFYMASSSLSSPSSRSSSSLPHRVFLLVCTWYCPSYTPSYTWSLCPLSSCTSSSLSPQWGGGRSHIHAVVGGGRTAAVTGSGSSIAVIGGGTLLS